MFEGCRLDIDGQFDVVQNFMWFRMCWENGHRYCFCLAVVAKNLALSRLYLSFRLGQPHTIMSPLKGDEREVESSYYVYDEVVGAWQCDGTKVFGGSRCGGAFRKHKWHVRGGGGNWENFRRAMGYLCILVDDYVRSSKWSCEAAEEAVAKAIRVLPGMEEYTACWTLRILLINATYAYDISPPRITSSVMPHNATEHLSTAPLHCRPTLDLENPAETQEWMLRQASKEGMGCAHEALSNTRCFAFEYNILFCFTQQVIDHFYLHNYGGMQVLCRYLRTLNRQGCALATRNLLLRKIEKKASKARMQKAKELTKQIDLGRFGIIEPRAVIVRMMSKETKKTMQQAYTSKMESNELYQLLKSEKNCHKHERERCGKAKLAKLRAKLMFEETPHYDIAMICLQLLDLGLLYMTRRRHRYVRRRKRQRR